MFKTILNFLSSHKVFNPFLRIILPFIKDASDINILKRETPIVVSLSAKEESFESLEYTLFSIFTQKMIADNIILWIDNEYHLSDLPYSITKFIKNGLDIRFVESKNSYTKTFYALKEYGDSIIVTADENIYYPKDWLSKLYLSYISNPNDIHVHTAVSIDTDDKNSLPKPKPDKFAQKEEASYKYLPLDFGGVLYPPECFVKDALREDIYPKKINVTYELWSWIMAVVSGRKIRLVRNNIRKFTTIDTILSFKKYYDFVCKLKNSDEQISQLFEYYGSNINSKFREK